MDIEIGHPRVAGNMSALLKRAKYIASAGMARLDTSLISCFTSANARLVAHRGSGSWQWTQLQILQTMHVN